MQLIMETSEIKKLLPDYLRQKGINLSKNFSCLNPEHNDKIPSMSYYEKGERVHCFSCGVSYDLFDIVGLDYNIDGFYFQQQKACEIFGVENKITPQVKKETTHKEEEVNYSNKTTQFWELFKKGESCSYLLERGITQESCEKYKFFNLKNREYMPFFSKGICYGWTSRLVTGEGPKYKNSKGALPVWNSDYIINNQLSGEKIYITEGIIDGVFLEQIGKKAVATGGVGGYKKLLQLLEKHKENHRDTLFIVCGDGDAAGKTFNKNLLEGIKSFGLKATVLLLGEGKDIADLYSDNKSLLEEKLLEEETGFVTLESDYVLESNAEYLKTLFNRTASQRGVSSGIETLDRLLNGGLYSGLYILGAASSIGKTSFVLKLADQFANSGEDVLFFSLEQSRNELIAKSLSRLSFKKEKITASDIIYGRVSPQSTACVIEEYKAVTAGNLFVKEGCGSIGPVEIRKAVAEHICARNKKPVVIVDYLQILAPISSRQSDKQNIDSAVVELKRISRDFGVPVLAVSSFNRDNYKNPVSMEAFKESGAVEYSADVLLGLQLKGVGTKGFDLNTAKLKEPRQLELVLLKNRSGLPYGKLEGKYYAKYGEFVF